MPIPDPFASVNASNAIQPRATWLAQGHLYGLHVVPWQEIAWLHTYSRRSVGVAPRHYVRVWSRDGTQLLLPPDNRGYRTLEQAEELLRTLAARAPWAEAGFSWELEQQWKKQRAAFVNHVDARRATVHGAG